MTKLYCVECPFPGGGKSSESRQGSRVASSDVRHHWPLDSENIFLMRFMIVVVACAIATVAFLVSPSSTWPKWRHRSRDDVAWSHSRAWRPPGSYPPPANLNR